MSGHHAAGGSSNGKLWIVIVALLVIVAVLGFMLISFILGDSAPEQTQEDAGISTQIAAQDAAGKNVTDKITVSPSAKRPDSVDPAADLILLDISWNAKREAAMPLIITIKDSSFIDDDGLAVYHYTNDQWVLLGTYLIANQAVSFQVDSLSPFAFQVISSKPEVTPTPEPTPEVTPEPTPEVTPEPTPEPVDYGKYDEVQEGLFVQATGLKEEANYVIAMIHPEVVDIPEDGETVVFGDDATPEKIYTATVFVNYDDKNIGAVDVLVSKTNDDKYYILDPVVEGMLWNAENAEGVSGTTRYSLVNNNKYLNLDNPNEFVVMDDDDGRTRWLYEEVDGKDDKEYNTLTYRANLGMYYVEEIKMVDAEEDEDSEGEPAQVLEITATGDEDEALELVIFRLDDGTEDVDTGTISGTLVLMSTPEANSGLDATPIPTINPDDDDDNSSGGGLPSFATPTAVPTAKPTAVPTAVPTTVPTAVPTAVPTTAPTTDPASGTNTQPTTQPSSRPASGTNT